jgi:hypothetical protein
MVNKRSYEACAHSLQATSLRFVAYGCAQRLVLSLVGAGEGLTSKQIAIWRKCHQCREYRRILDVPRNHDVNRQATGCRLCQHQGREGRYDGRCARGAE